MEGVITVGDIIDKALTGMFGNFMVAAVILPAAIIFVAYLIYIIVMTIKELRKKQFKKRKGPKDFCDKYKRHSRFSSAMPFHNAENQRMPSAERSREILASSSTVAFGMGKVPTLEEAIPRSLHASFSTGRNGSRMA